MNSRPIRFLLILE